MGQVARQGDVRRPQLRGRNRDRGAWVLDSLGPATPSSRPNHGDARRLAVRRRDRRPDAAPGSPPNLVLSSFGFSRSGGPLLVHHPALWRATPNACCSPTATTTGSSSGADAPKPTPLPTSCSASPTSSPTSPALVPAA